MELVKQLLIALLTTSLGSILTYLAAIRKSKDEIKAVEIKAEHEIKKNRVWISKTDWKNEGRNGRTSKIKNSRKWIII